MLHTIWNSTGALAHRPYFNFASQTFRMNGHDLILVVEHRDEVGLNVQSTGLVVPLLTEIYPALDWGKIEMAWASRYGMGTKRALIIEPYDPYSGQFAYGWRNEGFGLSRKRFPSDPGFVGTIAEIADYYEGLLSTRVPYSG